MDVPYNAPLEQTLRTVKFVIDKFHFTNSDWHTYDFKTKSYTKWAANELLIRLEDNKDVPPLIIIVDFIDEMDKYSDVNDCTKYRFSIARETAQWVEDLLTA